MYKFSCFQSFASILPKTRNIFYAAPSLLFHLCGNQFRRLPSFIFNPFPLRDQKSVNLSRRFPFPRKETTAGRSLITSGKTRRIWIPPSFCQRQKAIFDGLAGVFVVRHYYTHTTSRPSGDPLVLSTGLCQICCERSHSSALFWPRAQKKNTAQIYFTHEKNIRSEIHVGSMLIFFHHTPH